jgi:hypothetical protein
MASDRSRLARNRRQVPSGMTRDHQLFTGMHDEDPTRDRSEKMRVAPR